MIQRVAVISFTIMDKCGIVEWSTDHFNVTFSTFCYFSRIIGFRADVFCRPPALCYAVGITVHTSEMFLFLWSVTSFTLSKM